MKNSGIKKINTAGLVGYVICILLIVCSIASMVMVGIATVAAATVSKDNITVSVASDVKIDSTGNFLDRLNRFIKINGVGNLADLVTEDGSTLILPDSDISEITAAKAQDGGLDIAVKTNRINFSVKRIVAALVASFVFLGAVTVMLEMLKKLMKSLKTCETPFAPDIVKRMTRFAYSLIPVVILNSVCSGLWPTVSHGAEFNFTLNLGMVLLVAVIYLLVVIFRHGALLQQESDETL